MSATLSRTEDFTAYFSDNLRDFLARYPEIKERTLEEPQRLLLEAKTRMNAANARMIKARINKSLEDTTLLPEEQEHKKQQSEYFRAQAIFKWLETDIDKYLAFVTHAYSDHIRRFIDEDLPSCDTFEKFVYTVNLAHFNDIFDNYPLECSCGAKSDTFQSCLYFGTDPKHHVLVACKEICSYGTRMKISNREAHLKSRDFIEVYSEFNIDVVPA
jgi:hypothetical protein